MDVETRSHNLPAAMRHVFAHSTVTLMAVGIAFSLPVLAQYILYDWWPRVAGSSKLLLITEIAVGAFLVLLYNLSRFAWSGRRSLRMNTVASLVYAGEGSGGVRRMRELRESFTGARDVAVLSITGYDTFSADGCKLQQLLDNSYEVRVLLMHPDGEGAARRVGSLKDPEALRESYRRETATSIAYLKKLAAAGKKVTLKFYDDVPMWNLVVTGEHVWVQHCRDGYEVKEQPEYVFALQREHPNRGFFAPFYLHFLDQWNDPRHPEYSFDTDELVYRDAEGKELRRISLARPAGLGAPTVPGRVHEPAH
ncbi:MAG: hypothetical protein M0T84_09970 [Betaproteobacteria bacterium]|nr:hypothetical protein [Betaproteobacteria bacterium]